jgi:hypothetical protein
MKGENIDKLCVAIIEMMNATPHDLCGDQRAFYGARLGIAFETAARIFPIQMARAIDICKSEAGK